MSDQSLASRADEASARRDQLIAELIRRFDAGERLAPVINEYSGDVK